MGPWLVSTMKSVHLGIILTNCANQILLLEILIRNIEIISQFTVGAEEEKVKGTH